MLSKVSLSSHAWSFELEPSVKLMMLRVLSSYCIHYTAYVNKYLLTRLLFYCSYVINQVWMCVDDTTKDH